MKQEIAVPEAPETLQKGHSALLQAQGLIIADNESFSAAGELRSAFRAIQDEIDQTFDGPIAAAFQAHKAIVAAKKRYYEPLEEAQRLIKMKMIQYENEQERKRREEQARLDREARKRAEDEALALAATLEAAGAKAAAEHVLASEPIVEEIVLPKATPKVAGFSKRRIYSAEVTDRKAFLAAIVAGEIPDSAWMPDQQFLNKTAGAMKEAMGTWKGVRVFFKEV